MQVKTKLLRDGAKLPVRGSKDAAGSDVHACLDCHDILSIAAHSTRKIPTGLAIEIEPGYFGALFPRSGLSTDKGLRPANCVGVIDSDYRGEVAVALHNDTDLNQVIENGERIAQLIIIPYEFAEYVEADELSETERGADGFGSSGTKAVKKRKKRVEHVEIELDDEYWSA